MTAEYLNVLVLFRVGQQNRMPVKPIFLCSSPVGAAELGYYFMPLSFVALIQCSSCLFFFGFSAFIGTK